MFAVSHERDGAAILRVCVNEYASRKTDSVGVRPALLLPVAPKEYLSVCVHERPLVHPDCCCFVHKCLCIYLD